MKKRTLKIYKSQFILLILSFIKVRSYKKPQNYFVFLDSEIENSFESKVLNNKHNSITHDEYWTCLDEIFDKLSKKFKMNVKVAAHFRRGTITAL